MSLEETPKKLLPKRRENMEMALAYGKRKTFLTHGFPQDFGHSVQLGGLERAPVRQAKTIQHITRRQF